MYNETDNSVSRKREAVFLILSGIFLGSMTMLNVLGTSKILYLGSLFGFFSLTVPVGVLAYPITFLCTDLISELYGKRRANTLVWVGLLVNVWLLIIIYIGTAIPAWSNSPDSTTFDKIKVIATDTVLGSMVAYLVAQLIDVYVFHYFKTLTKGKKLWLRNNASTMTSQLVDTFIVILYVHFASDGFHLQHLSPNEVFNNLASIIGATYLFKFVFALLDTLPFYWLTSYLSKTLEIDNEKT
jgi:queuosine precursor transporter